MVYGIIHTSLGEVIQYTHISRYLNLLGRVISLAPLGWVYIVLVGSSGSGLLSTFYY